MCFKSKDGKVNRWIQGLSANVYSQGTTTIICNPGNHHVNLMHKNAMHPIEHVLFPLCSLPKGGTGHQHSKQCWRLIMFCCTTLTPLHNPANICFQLASSLKSRRCSLICGLGKEKSQQCWHEILELAGTICYHTIDIDFDGVNPNNVDIKITFKLLTYTTSTVNTYFQ